MARAEAARTESAKRSFMVGMCFFTRRPRKDGGMLGEVRVFRIAKCLDRDRLVGKGNSEGARCLVAWKERTMHRKTIRIGWMMPSLYIFVCVCEKKHEHRLLHTKLIAALLPSSA